MKSEEVLPRDDYPTLEIDKIQTRLICIEPTSIGLWQHESYNKTLSVNPHPCIKLPYQLTPNILQMAIA